MRYPALVILVASFIISCSSKNGTKELSTAVQQNPKNWPTTGWNYDTLKHSHLFKDLVDSFPGKYSLLIVNNGKMAFAEANLLLKTTNMTTATSVGFPKISGLSVSCFVAVILHQQK